MFKVFQHCFRQGNYFTVSICTNRKMEEEKRLEEINKYSGLDLEPKHIASAAEAHTKKLYCGIPCDARAVAAAHGKKTQVHVTFAEENTNTKTEKSSEPAAAGVALHMAGLGGKFAVVTEDVAVAQTTTQHPAPAASCEQEKVMEGAGVVRMAAAAVADVVKAAVGEAQALSMMLADAQTTDPDFATTFLS